MSIDLLVKISQITSPIVLAFAGYFISRSLNKQANSVRLLSSFNLKWAEVLIDKCVTYSNLVTDIVIKLQELSEDTHPSTEKQKAVNGLVAQLRHAEYDIQIHLDLVDGSSNIGAVVKQILIDLGLIFKNKEGSIDNIKSLQSKLNRELRKLHKTTLGI